MTNEEALKFCDEYLTRNIADIDKEFLKKAKEALQQEPCKYAISKKAVLYKIKEVCFSRAWSQFRSDYGSNGQRDFLINYIEQLPPVTPQPKTGQWIERFDKSDKWYECDQCHTDWGGAVNFCPNCGAKMQEVKE